MKIKTRYTIVIYVTEDLSKKPFIRSYLAFIYQSII